MTSLRELFMHVIHLLAPDDQIKTWTNDPSFFDNGRPTRKGRLKYIYRNITNERFKDFIKADVDTTLAFISMFQGGTHTIDSGYSPQQLIAIRSKAESTLKFILEIHFATNA